MQIEEGEQLTEEEEQRMATEGIKLNNMASKIAHKCEEKNGDSLPVSQRGIPLKGTVYSRKPPLKYSFIVSLFLVILI